MRKRFLAIITALAVAVPMAIINDPAKASPADGYSGPHFGADNFPAGCIRDMSASNPDNICHHMRTDLNGLDSSQVDVLVLVPASPTAERDMRIMRQSIEMWEGGIDYLATEMGLDWLAEGMDFHVSVDSFDPAGDGGGEFTTYPLVDPEIVVIATNPVGGVGIGVDPVDFVGNLRLTDEDEVPCHDIPNAFDFETWENLPGFESHHESRTGTYVQEDCGGSGGNVCFAVNGAIDPAPGAVDLFSLFDLVSHEVGHCLTIGHVGDGMEGTWGALPPNDIMAYSQDPPGLNKCVSTLDVEGIATRMSKYIDVNGDNAVTAADRLLANDQVGEGGNPFQVQHPDDHLYASGTGSPMDCPQPDLGAVPGERTDWTPIPVDTTGSGPTSSTGSVEDAADDGRAPITEILGFAVEVTPSHVDAVISLADLWPSTSVASGTSYSVVIDGRRFDSFVRYATDANPMTWDSAAGAYMPVDTSSWDMQAKTVSFHIPRSYLAAAAISAPYYASSESRYGFVSVSAVDDVAPESGAIGVTG